MKKGIYVFIIAAAVLLTATAYAGELTEVIEKDFKIGEGGKIFMDVNDGNIIIEAWDKDYVYVKATKRAYASSKEKARDMLEMTVVGMKSRGKTLDIKVEPPRLRNEISFFRIQETAEVEVDFEIRAPRSVSLDIRADESDIELTGTEGTVDITTDEGKIAIMNVVSDVMYLKADEGNIQLREVKVSGSRGLNIEVDEGEIDIRGGEISTLELEADEGNIRVKRMTVKEMYVSLDEGDLRLDLIPAPDCRLKIEADEGDIRLHLPKDVSLRYNLRTEEGRISTDVNGNREVVDEREGSRVKGELGSGEGSLHISADEGSITLTSGD